MLPFEDLAALRLRQFLPSDSKVIERRRFEWMNGLWLYEGIGFTWFGRLEQAPDVTAGLELSFDELESGSLQRILVRLGLPLTPGMRSTEIATQLGPVFQTEVYTDDRKTYVYRLGQSQVYEVSCTVQDAVGLIHVSVIRNDVRRRLAVATI
jgi:hypothetical protein